jgi:hypothetical protein
MADESAERPDPSSTQTGRHDGWGGASDRRRIIIGSLLVPPAVMTLKARSARATPVGSCAASFAANPNTSHHCVIPQENQRYWRDERDKGRDGRGEWRDELDEWRERRG